MALRRQSEVQGDLVVTWAEMPRSPGHAFFDRLHELLTESGFDGFVEATCKPYYAPRMGAPSLPPGRYFRMHMIGYFEGIGSERGIAWRCSDSLSLRAFLRLANRDKVPDHSWSCLSMKLSNAVKLWCRSLRGFHTAARGNRVWGIRCAKAPTAQLRSHLRDIGRLRRKQD